MTKSEAKSKIYEIMKKKSSHNPIFIRTDIKTGKLSYCGLTHNKRFNKLLKYFKIYIEAKK